MAHYSCYFLGRNGKALVVEDIEARSDGHALEQARRAFSRWPMFPAFELCQGDTLIHNEDRKRPAA
jgi:hypothetical protein